MIKHGTNRIVILTKNFAYKIPLGLRGIKANRNEYENAKKRKGFVADTEKHWWGLKQETLINTKIYPQGTTESEVDKEHKFLFPFKLHNRIQIGQDKKGNWKFYDYEDIKFKYLQTNIN